MLQHDQWVCLDPNKTMCSIFCSCAADNSSVILGVIGHCGGWWGCNSGSYRPQWGGGGGGCFDLNKAMCSIFCSCSADNSSVILRVIGHCKGWRGVIPGVTGHCQGRGEVCTFKITPKECCPHLDRWGGWWRGV